MKDSLTVGVSGSADHVGTDAMSPPHLPTKVLSTPAMVQLIEMTCLRTIQEHLDEGETTVGVHVCVSHVAAALSGQTVRIDCAITEIDRRRIVLATTVTCGEKVVSEGTHQRFVVKAQSFG